MLRPAHSALYNCALSVMTLTGEIMQIFGEGNRSFEGCQLDLGTPAMKDSNENLLRWQACVHTDNACMQITYSQSPREGLDK